MTKQKTTIAFTEWQHAVEEVTKLRADIIPEGWFNSEQLQPHLGKGSNQGVGPSHGRKLLHGLVCAGRAERKKFYVELEPGVVRKIWHYRLLKR